MKNFFFTVAFLAIAVSSYSQATPHISTSKAHTDLAYLISTFESVHYNPYFKTSKSTFDSLQKELVAQWNPDSISYTQFMSTAMELTATMSGGHSYVDWQNPVIFPQIKEFKYLPFTGIPDSISQSVIITRSSHPDFTPGMKVKEINGVNAIELFEQCMRYIGGIRSFKIANTEKAFPLYLFFTEQVSAPYTFTLHNGPTPLSSEGVGIAVFAKMINASQATENYTFEIIDGVGVIHYNSCSNYNQFNKFLKTTFATIADQNIRKLIVDIRTNGGGDSRLNDLLLNYITPTPYRQSSGRYWKVSKEAKQFYASKKVYAKIFGKQFMNSYMNTPNGEVIVEIDSNSLVYPKAPKNYFTGQTCMLIGPNTFSSANFLADAVKTFSICPLIGQPTGEYTNDFGEQLSFQLPHSNCYVYISSTYDIGANGDAKQLAPVTPQIYTEEDALPFAIQWMKEN